MSEKSDAATTPHERGMAAARRRAEWELGDPAWAGIIVGAYLHPDEDAAELDAEQEATR